MGAPYMFRAILTTSMARTTPAQKPRGRNKIIFFPAADIGVDIEVPIITIQQHWERIAAASPQGRPFAPYSYRRATIGSALVARREGT